MVAEKLLREMGRAFAEVGAALGAALLVMAGILAAMALLSFIAGGALR